MVVLDSRFGIHVLLISMSTEYKCSSCSIRGGRIVKEIIDNNKDTKKNQ